jgi:hypothetical protein
VVSTRPETLSQALRRLMCDPAEAAELGKAGRGAALARYGLSRFLDDWDHALADAVC